MGREFDTAKGAFWLVALVIATQMIVIMGAVAYCAVGTIHGSFQVGACSDMQAQIKELFQMSFTAAIAFAGGRLSAPQPTTPRLPEKTKGEHDNG